MRSRSFIMSGIEADAPVVTHTEMAIVQPWIPLHMNRRWIYSDEHLDEFDFRFDASGEDRDENWRCPERYAQLIPYCLRLYSDGWQPVPSYCCSLNEVFCTKDSAAIEWFHHRMEGIEKGGYYRVASELCDCFNQAFPGNRIDKRCILWKAPLFYCEH